MTATSVPIWTRTSKAKAKAESTFHPNTHGTRTRWAEDEMGRNSATPWTTPRMKPWMRVKLVLQGAVFAVGAEKTLGEGPGPLLHDRLTQSPGKRDERRQIVNGDQGRREYFAGDDQMAQVGPAEVSAGVAAAFGVDRAAVLGVGRAAKIDSAQRGEGGMVACQASGQNAVHQVDSAHHRLHEILERPDAHQVAGPIRRQGRLDRVQDGQSILLGLAEREAADGDAREAEPADDLGRTQAQVFEDAPLQDAEEDLIVAGLGSQSALGPGVRSFQGTDIDGALVRRRAFIEGHDDVGTELLVDEPREHRHHDLQ